MSKHHMQRFELWKEPDGFSFFPSDNDSARAALEPDAKLIWTVEAESWEEASKRKNEYLGWEEYRPL
jgi:hypothetical protein